MTEPKPQRVRALFDQAADLPPTDQRAFLDACCPDDPDLRARVEYLLACDARTRRGGRGGSTPLCSAARRRRTLSLGRPHRRIRNGGSPNGPRDPRNQAVAAAHGWARVRFAP
jgi:hypothetical protein